MGEIVLLDGGLGQELVRRSGDRPTPLWSTQVMLDHPELVQQVHADFLAAGASVVTANTYALHRDRLGETAMDGQFEELFHIALLAVRQARAHHGSGRIAGSIGPLVASYRPDVHPDQAVALPLYTEVAAKLAVAVDLILCETVASVDHLRAVLAAAKTTGLPCWVAMTVDDTDGSLLRSGEPVSVAAIEAKAGGADAVLANCSAPEAMSAALAAIAPTGLPHGAYANAFREITKEYLRDRPTVDVLAPRTEMSPERYAEIAMGWVAAGATIVGGCCEVGPDHIAELARRLRDAGHRIV